MRTSTQHAVLYDQDDLINYPIWKHIKTGGLYHVLGVAYQQGGLSEAICHTNGDADGRDISVVYFSVTHQTVNYRLIGEFLDGRFEPVVPEET